MRRLRLCQGGSVRVWWRHAEAPPCTHLFDDDPNLRARADALAGRTFELISFLTDVRGS